jgi:predicted aspartyl protease
MRITAFFILVGLAGLHPGSAAAADAPDCRLKMLNSIAITLTPEGDRVLVPMTINGTDKMFLLDTGGAATQITPVAASDLKLMLVASDVKMLDLYGNPSTTAAKVDSLTLGRMHDKNAKLPILPSTFGDNPPFVGILAADYMAKYDVELDFTGGRMNYFSPDHCEGKVVYWPATAGTAVPIRFVDHHLTLQVMLDGKTLKAEIDTGAANTTLSAAAAKQMFGVTADTPGDKTLYEDRGAKAFEHVFQNLSFEGMAVNNPHIVVLPDKVGSRDVNNDFVTGSRVHRVDDVDSSAPVMLIGMNVLRNLHLYIAFSESKIYITPASPPPATKPSP